MDFILSFLLVAALTGFCSYKLRNKVVIIFYAVFDLLYLFSLCFDLSYFSDIALFVLLGGTILFLFVNAGVIRKYVALPLKQGKGKAPAEDKDPNNHEKVIEGICQAVTWLSENKVGALITIERDTPLDDYMKSGTIINCPVTPEIIETIFYEGTRLHDGAIIIRNDVIVAAAVYYPPSTKPIVGKFGARHRAALGISEVTDSITIVVSEETGRIAISHTGMMDNVKSDEFEKVFRNQIAGENK